MIRTKVTHGKGECMEVNREGKEVKCIGEDVSIGDGKTHKQERNKGYVVKCWKRSKSRKGRIL